jgi:hypothetical protein
MVSPLWLLVFDLPAWGVGAVLFTSALFVPLINAPFLAVLTRRTCPRSASRRSTW